MHGGNGGKLYFVLALSPKLIYFSLKFVLQITLAEMIFSTVP